MSKAMYHLINQVYSGIGSDFRVSFLELGHRNTFNFATTLVIFVLAKD